MNIYESRIMFLYGEHIKYLSIDIIASTERQRIVGIRLSTIILKRGHRNKRIGSVIIADLKQICDNYNRYLKIPVGVGNKTKLRNFYEKNKLTQEFDSQGFEYYTYNKKQTR